MNVVVVVVVVDNQKYPPVTKTRAAASIEIKKQIERERTHVARSSFLPSFPPDIRERRSATAGGINLSVARDASTKTVLVAVNYKLYFYY